MSECKHKLIGTQYDPAECVRCGKTLVEILEAKIVELVAQNERLDMLYESAQDRAKQCRNKLRACKKRMAKLEAKLKWLEGLLRMNQICNCCGDHLSEGACANLDCGRYGANQ